MQGYKICMGSITKRNKWSKHDKPMPEEAKVRMQWALDNAWADSTMEKYKYGINAFHKFCNKAGVPSMQSSCQAGEIAGGTVRSVVAAVTAWLAYLQGCSMERGATASLHAEGSKESHTRIIETRGMSTEEMINILKTELDLDDPKDAVVFAAVCCVFWGQIHLGEMLSNTQSKYFIGRIPTATTAGTQVLKLPWTMTKGERSDKAILCCQHMKSDLVNAVENHIAVNAIPADLPLFAYHN
ncbi:hypothetical protein DFH08DRAFT_930328 [Mycena albidolilacea]|uniref:Uncharacterized protein n=1 Tax=Mycena albidolilacea TaxID=1033008 RepID=A0AAD7AQ93_9AGAR|nr:hypothetical protein DFH08DRAFT_930328 [Mycena albidolilacea]